MRAKFDSTADSSDNRLVRARPRVPVALTLGALAVLASVVVLGAGCKRHKGGATCDAAGARFLELAHQGLDADATLDAAGKRGVRGLLAPARDAMVRACREDGWAEDARACFVAAADPAAFRACEAKLTAPQRELLHTAASKGIQP